MNTSSSGKNDDDEREPAGHDRPRILPGVARALGQNAVDGVRSGLAALEARFGRPAWMGALTGTSPEAQAERLRDVIDRDRALSAASPRAAGDTTHTAQPAVTAADPAPTPTATKSEARGEAELAAAPAAGEARCDEPIRTRTMARLLAAQGHPQRALAIYEWLRATQGADEALSAEIEALRQQAGSQ